MPQSVKFHSIADLLPLIEGEEFDALVADILAFGLREPIVTLDGKILDGRNRYRACLAAGVEPLFLDFDPELDGGSPLDFVISKNLKRRHLDESQRAMAAGRLATLKLGSNQHERGDAQIYAPSQDAAAARLLVSRRLVQSARKVLDSGEPEVIRAVDQGRLTVSLAVTAVTLPRSQQQEIAQRAQDGTRFAPRSNRRHGRGARPNSLNDRRLYPTGGMA
jgi:hypothetical protein